MMWRWRWHNPKQDEILRVRIEAMRERARLRALGQHVDDVLERRHKLIRENHFGPQIAHALGVADREKDKGQQGG